MQERKDLYTEKFLKERIKRINKSRGKDEYGTPIDYYDDKENGLPGIIPISKKGKKKESTDWGEDEALIE
mgnify:CR=1 FL=1